MFLYVGVILLAVEFVKGEHKQWERRSLPDEIAYSCIYGEEFQTARNVTSVICHSTDRRVYFTDVPRFLDRMVIDRLSLSNYYGEDANILAGWLQGIRVRELEFHNIQTSYQSSNKIFHLQSDSLKGQEYTLNKFALTNSKGFTGVRLIGLATMKNLIEIDLSWNGIETIGYNSIPTSGLKNLQKLCLSHNKIQIVYWDTIYPMPNLRIFNLSHNSLRRISTEDRLSVYSYYHQKYEPIGWDSKSVDVMDFSYNLIESVEESFFEQLAEGSTVLFQHNYLEELPTSVWLPAVLRSKIVNLSENFFTCNCDMAWINVEKDAIKNTVNCFDSEKFQLIRLTEFFDDKDCD